MENGDFSSFQTCKGSTAKASPAPAPAPVSTVEAINNAKYSFLNMIFNERHIKHLEFISFKFCQIPRKCSNMTEFLARYGEDIAKLDLGNAICGVDVQKPDINAMISETKDGEDVDFIHYNKTYLLTTTKYKYDKKFKNEKHTNKQIIKFIVNYFYNHLNNEKKIHLIEKIKFMIDEKFKYPFIYLDSSKNNSKMTYYPINYLFKWFKKLIKAKGVNQEFKKIMVNNSFYIPEQIIQAPLKNFTCYICMEDVPFCGINKPCSCVENICLSCFNNLQNPKKCPTCRRNNFTLNISNQGDIIMERRKIIFNYNNTIISRDLEKNYHYQSSFFYLKENEIKSLKIKIRTEEELKDSYIENSLSDAIIHFNAEFLHSYFNPSLPYDLFEVMAENLRYGHAESLMEYLGLSNDCRDEESVNFVNWCIEQDGFKQFLGIGDIWKRAEINKLGDEEYLFICDDFNFSQSIEI